MEPKKKRLEEIMLSNTYNHLKLHTNESLSILTSPSNKHVLFLNVLLPAVQHLVHSRLLQFQQEYLLASALK